MELISINFMNWIIELPGTVIRKKGPDGKPEGPEFLVIYNCNGIAYVRELRENPGPILPFTGDYLRICSTTIEDS